MDIVNPFWIKSMIFFRGMFDRDVFCSFVGASLRARSLWIGSRYVVGGLCRGELASPLVSRYPASPRGGRTFRAAKSTKSRRHPPFGGFRTSSSSKQVGRAAGLLDFPSTLTCPRGGPGHEGSPEFPTASEGILRERAALPLIRRSPAAAAWAAPEGAGSERPQSLPLWGNAVSLRKGSRPAVCRSS